MFPDKSPHRKTKKVDATEKIKLQSNSTNRNIIREIVSPKNPPYINSKNRLTELSVESDLHKKMNIKSYPCLAYFNFKNWTSRTKNDKDSYLDTIYLKELVKLYKVSHLTALQSKMKLKFLTSSMQKLVKSEEVKEKMPIRVQRNSIRLSLIADKFNTHTKISSKKFQRDVHQRFNQIITDYSERLDSLHLKKKILKPK